VIGLAVTKEGIPVRCWCWPGNTSDATILPEVKDHMRGWRLGRIITVVDRGFSSANNLAYLRRVGGHFIAGMRMRDGNPLIEQVLVRQGCYQQDKQNLRVKEIRVDDTDVRFIICHNPEQAQRNRTQREKAITRLEAELERIKQFGDRDRTRKTSTSTKTKAAAAHTKAECALRDHLTLGRWLRQSPSGRLSINRAKISKRSGWTASTSSPPPTRTSAPRTPRWATRTGRTRLPGPKVQPAAAADLPPARTLYPRPRAAVLAGAAARPGRRTPRRPDLAPHRHRTRPHPRRHPHRKRRHRRAHDPADHHPSSHFARLSGPRTGNRDRARPA